MRQPSIDNQRAKVLRLTNQVNKLESKLVELNEAKEVLANLTSSTSIDDRLSRLEELKAEQVKLEADIQTAKDNAVSETTDTGDVDDSVE